MSERSGVYYDRSVFIAFQRGVNSQERRHLRHAREGGIEQRLDLFTSEDGPALDDGEDRIAVLAEKSAEFALRVDLPDPELVRGGESDRARSVAEFRLKDIG